MGLEGNRELIRPVAQQLIEGSAEAARLRANVACEVSEEPLRRGGILAALRRSPLAGADLDLPRDATSGRSVDL